MDEIKLRYFISVARHLNFSQAAAECHVSQSTISRQIAVLEKDLGHKLFIRDTQSVRLTDAGQRLFGSTSPIWPSTRPLTKISAPCFPIPSTGSR